MAKVMDLTGQTFGRLTVLERKGSNSKGSALWLCQCSCGGQSTVITSHLRNGNTTSCGCFHKERLLSANSTHNNGSKHELWRTWESMIRRCSDPKASGFKYYGARGIQVCDEWKGDFWRFVQDMGPRPPGTSLDRVDNSLGYSPENCRWATAFEQSTNKRTNRVAIVDGERMAMAAAAKKYGINKNTLWYRVSRMGLSIDDAIKYPYRKRKVA